MQQMSSKKISKKWGGIAAPPPPPPPPPNQVERKFKKVVDRESADALPCTHDEEQVHGGF